MNLPLDDATIETLAKAAWRAALASMSVESIEDHDTWDCKTSDNAPSTCPLFRSILGAMRDVSDAIAAPSVNPRLVKLAANAAGLQHFEVVNACRNDPESNTHGHFVDGTGSFDKCHHVDCALVREATKC